MTDVIYLYGFVPDAAEPPPAGLAGIAGRSSCWTAAASAP